MWQGSECASGLPSLFCHGSKRNTQELLIYAKLIIVFTSEFSPYSEVKQGSATTKLTKGWQRWKKNDQLFNLLFLVFLSFSWFQCPRQ